MPVDTQTLKYSPPKRKRAGEYLVCEYCNKRFYLIPARVKRGEKFCSIECRNKSTKVKKHCPVCDKDYWVNRSIQNRYRVCSKECKSISVKYQNCKRCGRKFAVYEKRYSRYYCSEECRRPPKYINCKNCNKEFRVLPGDADRQFCCLACYRSYNGETLLEKQARLALDELNISYKQEHKCGRYSIDFYLPRFQIAIEVDGDYWHRDKERDRCKEKYLEKHNIHTVRITENEIKLNAVTAISNQLNKSTPLFIVSPERYV